MHKPASISGTVSALHFKKIATGFMVIAGAPFAIVFCLSSVGNMVMEYIYLGDRNTDPLLKGKMCCAIRRLDGKCIRSKNGSMLVQFANSRKQVVTGRLLRKIKIEQPGKG